MGKAVFLLGRMEIINTSSTAHNFDNCHFDADHLHPLQARQAEH